MVSLMAHAGWAGAQAQSAAPAASAPASAASAPARAAAAPGRPASGAQPAQRIEITGGRSSDTDQRRQSTAAKIIVGREEIDKFGDATVGEVLRRLPGVTTPGAPGRGGPPRMRGLGGGFTLLLIDGQRVPPGFSLESLTPDMIERIEILRAPTAETGAQAIAGTINIITREGFRRRLNDWRIGLGSENGQPSGGTFWTHNDSAGSLTYTLSAALFANRRKNESHTDVTVSDALTGSLLEERHSASQSVSHTLGLHLNARLQWRLGGGAGAGARPAGVAMPGSPGAGAARPTGAEPAAAGMTGGAEAGAAPARPSGGGEGSDSLILMPGLFANRNRSHFDYTLAQTLIRPGLPERADLGFGNSRSAFSGPRLGWQYRQRVNDWRLESGGNMGYSISRSHSDGQDLRANGSSLYAQTGDNSSREKSLRLNLKGSRLLGAEGSEHSLVMGAEAESANRRDKSESTLNGAPTLTEFGDAFEASTMRYAAYAQDEWSLNANWALHAGVRWEGITTRGDDGLGNRPLNRNSVTTPLVHILWKPNPAKRDQVRLSLTRSWRAPGTGSLIGRPSISRLYPAEAGTNTRTSADSAGNPSLKPELARGLDLAFERYLDGGGLLSANLFARRINNLMRSTVEFEDDVAWSPYSRWVRRTRNIGKASTQGIELEAKFRLDQLFTGATPVELRSNVSFYRSNVDDVPGPNNRLDQQTRATANFGGDYRLRGTPLTVGGNVNWVPRTTTRLAVDQVNTVPDKRVWDMFALWTFSPTVGLRLLANNLAPREYVTESEVQSLGPTGRDELTRSLSGGPSYTNWQLRLELKL